MNIRVLGAHNMEVDHARHTCFLLDGVVAIDAGSLMTSLTQEEMDGIQALLLTHRHFDHVRDVPSLGLSTLDNGGTISMYSLPETLDAVRSRLMDGVLSRPHHQPDARWAKVRSPGRDPWASHERLRLYRKADSRSPCGADRGVDSPPGRGEQLRLLRRHRWRPFAIVS